MNPFDTLTAYIPFLETAETSHIGQWISDRENDGTPERPLRLPFVSYSETVIRFIQDFYAFVESHPEMELNRYRDILQSRGLDWRFTAIENADVSNLDAQGVLALIMGAVRGERFSEGTLFSLFESGCILRWLHRLRDLG